MFSNQYVFTVKMCVKPHNLTAASETNCRQKTKKEDYISAKKTPFDSFGNFWLFKLRNLFFGRNVLLYSMYNGSKMPW